MLKLTVFNDLDMKKMEEIAKRQGKSACKERAEKIFKEIEEGTPVKSGYLKSQNFIEETKHGFDVGNRAQYAEYVDKMPQKMLDKTGHGGKTHFVTGPFMKYRWGKGGNDVL